jgi:hypothetical protein
MVKDQVYDCISLVTEYLEQEEALEPLDFMRHQKQQQLQF